MLAVLNEDFPKVKNSTANDVEDLINYILNILNIQKPYDNDTIDTMDNQMLIIGDLIRTKFGFLTIPEIKEAFKMYVSKEFPELKVFRIMDAICIGEVLNAFINYRSDALRIYSQKKTFALSAKTEPTINEKQKIRSEYVEAVFNALKDGNKDFDFWLLYDELDNAGKLKVSVAEKKQMYEKELKKYIPEEEDRIRKRSVFGTSPLIKELKKQVQSKEPITTVQNRCRSLVVFEYLKNYVTDFETFKKEIE